MKIFINQHEEQKGNLESNNIEQGLIGSDINSIKLELLKMSLCAHIFDQHVVKSSLINMNLHIKQKQKSSSEIYGKIKEIMQKDLVLVMDSGKGTVGYGIKYKILYGTLYFGGVVEEEMIGKTIVLQFITHGGRIIKEMCIVGERSFEKDSIPILEPI